MKQITLSPFKLSRSSVASVWAALSRDERQWLERWIESGQGVNDELRLSFNGTVADSYRETIHFVMQKAARFAVAGQELWRGGAWPEIGASWVSDEYTCCTAEREIAEGLVRNPAWPWPAAKHIMAGEHSATPGLARIVIGKRVKAVPVALLLDRMDDDWWTSANIIEQEVVLLPCKLTVIGREDDGTFIVLAEGS